MTAKKGESLHDVVRELASNYATMHRDVAGVIATVREQQATLNQVTAAVSDLTAALKNSKAPNLRDVITFALSVGALVSMLVAGITYIVAGSQLPHLDAIKSDVRLLSYRIEQLEKAKPATGRASVAREPAPGS